MKLMVSRRVHLRLHGVTDMLLIFSELANMYAVRITLLFISFFLLRLTDDMIATHTKVEGRWWWCVCAKALWFCSFVWPFSAE